MPEGRRCGEVSYKFISVVVAVTDGGWRSREYQHLADVLQAKPTA